MVEREKPGLHSKIFKIAWVMPEDVRAIFANHLLVSHQSGQFILNFAEAVVPPLLTDEQFRNAPEKVDTKIFLRVAVPTESVPGMIAAIQKNYDRYLKEREAGVFDVQGSPDE